MTTINYKDLSIQMLGELLIKTTALLSTLNAIGGSEEADAMIEHLNNICLKCKRELKARGITWS